MKQASPGVWWVVCLCAQWCGTCNQYRPAFEALRAQFPAMQFGWLDIEDEEDALGELDVTTFPTLLIGRGEEAVFLGPLQPHIEVLQRMLARFAEGGVAALAQGDDAHALLARAKTALRAA